MRGWFWVPIAMGVACGQETGDLGGTGTQTSGGSGPVGLTSGGSDDGAADGFFTAGCRAILNRDPGAEDGVYSLVADGGDTDGPSDVPVYCDMTTEGGGWTLIGRSAVTDETKQTFGWSRPTGTLGDETVPYSLDVTGVGLGVREILVGTYDAGKVWGDVLYRIDVPEDFWFIYNLAPYPVRLQSLRGGCEPEAGPSALQFIGHTAGDYVFYLGATENWSFTAGLGPAGFDVGDASCEVGGLLHGRQGMIFVR